MTTQSRLTELGFFNVNGLAWLGDDSSDYDYDYNSLFDSATSSSGYESVIAEDLDLYESGCIC
jgi:hypothetical protein